MIDQSIYTLYPPLISPKVNSNILLYYLSYTAGNNQQDDVDVDDGMISSDDPDYPYIQNLSNNNDNSIKVNNRDDVSNEKGLNKNNIYEVDPNRSQIFYEAIAKYWPDIPKDSLVPDYSGIRPKLCGPFYSSKSTYVKPLGK